MTGVRVLDLTEMLPGPYASLVFAQLGATVIKVERPPSGDPLRRLVPAMYSALNRGKASVVLDLRRRGDRDTLLALAAGAEVFMEGFRPGVAERLGAGFADIARQRADIVYLSMSGWGDSGPLATAAAHNENALAVAGAVFLSGQPGQPPGDSAPIPVADLGASLFAVIGVLSALRLPGRGAVHLDSSMLAAGLALAGPRLIEYGAKQASSRDELLDRPACGVFRAADGKYLSIMAVEDHRYAALCQAIGRPDLAADVGLATYPQRFAQSARIAAALAGAFGGRPRDEWVADLQTAGVPCAPVLEPPEVASHPQVAALGMIDGSWPELAFGFPVAGLAYRRLAAVDQLDGSGPEIRAARWECAAD
jgi:crotonobetainyl-CoA:carnitine CoA-transferase CaiB-like acyl-CoA transferase